MVCLKIVQSSNWEGLLLKTNTNLRTFQQVVLWTPLDLEHAIYSAIYIDLQTPLGWSW